jgi:hypothetical protein
MQKLQQTDGLTALWDFTESAGEARIARGEHKYPLQEESGLIERVGEGPLSGYSARFEGGQYLMLPWGSTGDLNIYGENQGITVMAWVKWSGKVSSFVAGMWNEYEDGGKRQYGLFLSLPHYNGKDQVCGHISRTGKPNPPFPYSIDYSASAQEVEPELWSCVSLTYDGKHIRSYYNGRFETRHPEQILHTIGFEGYPEGLVQQKNPYYFPGGMGNNGSDFTVGAVLLKKGMGNYFEGLIGGLAVFDRALTEAEMKELAIVPGSVE